MIKGLRAGKSQVMVKENTSGPKYEAADGQGGYRWLCIANSSDVDAMVAEFYA